MIIAGRYEATGAMKAGGMSEAHECQDILLNRPVILKTLRRDQEQRRLSDERKALLKLRSNHVVQLLDIVSVNDAGKAIPCLVLEFIHGDDLQEGQLAVGLSYVEVLWQIAKGLQEIHAANIVHRDIKPNNLRRDKEGVVKIIDFGLSREVGIDNYTHSAIGYLPYMAPELLAKGAKSFSFEADVYAYAVVALAISSLGLPEWCRKRDTFEAPASLCATHLAGLDAHVQTTLQACLAGNPAARPKIADVLTSLERVLLRDRHKARIVVGGKVNELDKSNRTSSPTVSSGTKVISQIKINYDGNDFLVTSVIGKVYANNIPINVGFKLPPSCVLSFQTGTSNPRFATFDISNPEYMV